jgi:DNA helicase-2/ATP-dependent DNA helicase PcrA
MPWDDGLTQEKKDIINDDARIKIVRAGPGSGKTTLFVAALRRALAEWHDTRTGIAALSYTNIAQQEITKKAGHIPPPHLVTTIDGFVLRYIIKPFAGIVTGNLDGTRLLPAPVASSFGEDTIQVGANRQDRGKLTEVTFIQHDENGHVVLKAKTTWGTITVPNTRRDAVLAEKRRFWRRGFVTHSDTHYLAYETLHHPIHGNPIARLIARRFPVMLIDEYQDTNYFLAHTIKRLLAQPEVQGLVVGDTDQAIFEFGGAHPRLFGDIEALDGARTFPLRITHRCPRRVVAVATHLAQSPIEPTDQEGTALLLAHQDDPRVLYDAITAMRQPGDRIAILARRTATVAQLSGHITSDFPGGCKLAERLSEAADALLTDPKKAGQITSTELGELFLQDRYPTHATLEREHIALSCWRRATWRVLNTAATRQDDETWCDWVLRLRSALRAAAQVLNRPINDTTINRRLQVTQGMHAPRIPPHPAQPILWPGTTTLDTIHGVKGDGFDIVALYCPRPINRGLQRCITTQWWDQHQTEEQRVAYVATTRAKRAYILCVHQTTYDALRNQQPAFFASFQQASTQVRDE